MTDVRQELHALIDKLIDAIESTSSMSEWVDQKTSPLGRRRHLELARRGTLRSSKDAGRVLIRRADIEAYLAKKAVIRVDESADEEREAARIIATMQRKSA
jgi:hypothetical protein